MLVDFYILMHFIRRMECLPETPERCIFLCYICIFAVFIFIKEYYVCTFGCLVVLM